MKRVLFLIYYCLISSFWSFTNAQNSKIIDAEVRTSHAQFLGKTPEVRHLVPLPRTSLEKKKANKTRKIIPNFLGRRPFTPSNPNGLPNGPDPVRQLSIGGAEDGIPIEPLLNFDGMGFDIGNVQVSDVCGDTGQDYYIQMVNASWFQVFNKDGDAISDPIATNTIWSSIGFQSAGDPIILYDQEANRWIITEFPFGNQLLVAISETSDPLGSWNAYNFATPNFPDYPKYSLWQNALCVTTNEGGPETLHSYFLNRQQLLDGAPMVDIQRIALPGTNGGPGFFVATPVDWTGNTPPPANSDPMILKINDDAWGDSPQDQIDMFTVNIDWDTPANTTVNNIEIITEDYDATNVCAAPGFGFACIPQMNGAGIDGIPQTIMHQTHYRNFGSHESIVLNFIVNAGGADVISGIRWMELRRTAGSEWSVYQEGTLAPDDGLHRFMGGIAMDESGNIGLAYSVSSENSFAGLRFTGRKSSDPLGEMTVDEYVVIEGQSASNTDRFGDYAQMTVDPSDDRTFWYTGQYMQNGGNWGTRIFSFQITRDTIDIGPTALLTPQDSPDLTNAEILTVDFKNFGLETQSGFDVGYIYEGGAPVIEDLNITLEADSVYTHTFATPIDASVVGPHDIKIFTILAEDQAPFNDTLRAIINKIPRYDIGITSINNLFANCVDFANPIFTLTNFGVETITSATIEIFLNGTLVETINWTGSLVSGATETLTVQINNLQQGMNEVSAITSKPNDETDEIAANDESIRTFNAIVNGVTIGLQINTDQFPQEVTWELRDEDDNVIFAGGPYDNQNALEEEEFCLDPEACYTFTISDSYGDGICCGYGDGNYQILDENGFPLLTGDGQYGSGETNEFCATFVCMLTADVDISPVNVNSGANGSLLINPINGVGPYQYSIDGGTTFQDENLFTDLTPGDYDIVITGQQECLHEETVTLGTCNLELLVNANNPSNTAGNNGTIIVATANGIGPYQYSIDGGVTLQNSTIFGGLSAGDYQVYAIDGNGCVSILEVMLDFKTSIENFTVGQTIEVFPNPNDGLFSININGLDRADVFLKLQVFDATGKMVQTSQLVKYDGVYTAQVSLVAYPSGVYFVRFLDDQVNRLVRVVKE